MTTSTEQEIERLHMRLATINARGNTKLQTPSEKIEVDGLWARIERLESAQVATTIKENNARTALLEARQQEGMQ